MDRPEADGKDPQAAGAGIPCRCRFRTGDPCRFKCGKRVASCNECGLGGRKFEYTKKLKGKKKKW